MSDVVDGGCWLQLTFSITYLLNLDGLARVGAAAFSELRNAVFANVAQRSIRRVARSVFTHLLRLDLGWHLSRQTGGLTRAIDRGTKGISFLLSSIVFHIIPTALEITMVCGILSYKCGWDFAAVTMVTMAAYAWFTIRTTAWRTKFRKEANAADNRGATTSVDSLLNYEAVKVRCSPTLTSMLLINDCSPSVLQQRGV